MTQYGKDHHSAKLTEDDVRTIRKMRKDGYKLKDITLLFSVNESNVWKAINRISWRRVK